MLKRSLFYHVDKNRDKNVPLKHRGTLFARRNNARSLRKSIFTFSLIKIAETPEFSITFCCAPMHTMFKYVVLWYAEEISLSLCEGPFYLKKCALCLFLFAWRHL